VETYEFSCTKETYIGNNVITFVIPNVVVENVGIVKAQVKVYADVSTVLNSVLFSFCVNASLSVGLTPDTDIPTLYVAPIIGLIPPTTSTVGLLGQQYVDTVEDNLYYCSDITGSVYTWTIISTTDTADYTSVSDATNIFACDLLSKRLKSFYFTIADSTTKTITFSNVPTGRCEVFLEITATDTAAMTWTLNGGTVNWSLSIAPALTTGYVYRIMLITNDSGTTWDGYLAGGVA